MTRLPLARNKGIVVQDMDEEILAYDLVTHKAYCLNQTASRVYRACDARSSFEGLKRTHKFTDEIIFLAIDELKKAKLVEENDSYVSPFTGMSRREVIRRVGLASMIALPVISSLVAPKVTHAQSGRCVNPGGIPPGSSQSFPGLTCGFSCNGQTRPDCPCAFMNCDSQCCSGIAVMALDNSSMTLCFC